MKRPLIFISHASKDDKLAKGFCSLLQGASGGMLPLFLASDGGDRGIGPGEEWYITIMQKLQETTDFVALLTPRSVSRPWIFYEAGVAKAHAQASVFGVAFDIPLEDATRHSPFERFQNFVGDEESLTMLVTQLIRRNLVDAQPVERTIRHEVRFFLDEHTQAQETDGIEPPEEKQDLAAKIYEEIKLISRALHRNALAKLIGPRLPQEFPLVRQSGGYDATGWLLLLGALREGLPWLYEAGLDLHRALTAGEPAAIARAREQVLRSLRLVSQNNWVRSMLLETDRELAFRLHVLPDSIEAYLNQLLEPDPRTNK